LRVREEAKNLAGRQSFRLIQIRLTAPSLEKITLASQDNSQRLELPFQLPQTRSTFHPHAQRNAFRRRDVRQSRSFGLARIRRSPLESFLIARMANDPAMMPAAIAARFTAHGAL
jgi:hypothetical protein